MNVERIHLPRMFWADLYHFFLACRWRTLFVTFATLYLTVNLFFALLYLAGGACVDGARAGNLGDVFFFSVQSISTIGYGHMIPVGLYANGLVTVESFLGMMMVAMMTGLIFAKFSRPIPRVLFTNKILYTQREGTPSLVLRMANARTYGIVSAQAGLTMLIDDTTTEGEAIRRFHTLPLRVDFTPLFALSWVISHSVDEKSPLLGLDRDALIARRALFTVSLSGLDETLAVPIHARHFYQVDDLRWGGRFTDLLSYDGGRGVMDFEKFHGIVDDGN